MADDGYERGKSARLLELEERDRALGDVESGRPQPVRDDPTPTPSSSESVDKAGAIGGLIGVLIGIGFVVWVFASFYGIFNKTPAERAQKARELDAWIAKREADERVRRTNEIIYEEMVRQRVRESQ